MRLHEPGPSICTTRQLPSLVAIGWTAVALRLRQGLWHAYAVALTTLPLVLLALGALTLLVLLALWPVLAALWWRVVARRSTPAA